MKRDVREGESFGLVADRPNGVFREAAPAGVGCTHLWRTGVVLDEGTGEVLFYFDHESCVTCKATCRRDDKGVIVEYETEESRRLAAEIRAHRAVA